MRRTACLFMLLLSAALVGATGIAEADPEGRVRGFNLVGRYDTGLGEGAAEIVAWSAEAQRLYVVNAAAVSVDIIDLSDPAAPGLIRQLEIADYGSSANGVAVHDQLVAIAVEGTAVDANGLVLFTDLDGNVLATVEVGVLPDMVTFTPDGRFVLTANEGEPSDDYSIDPEGSVSVIDITRGLNDARTRTADFRGFNARLADLREAGLRIYGPGASLAQDVEPEYIAVSPDSRTAYVSLQENNAIAIVDIPRATVSDIAPLGFKDHSQPANRLDASNRDGGIRLRTWPVHGMYQPDAIATVRIGGRDYLLTANEGDARDYDGYSEETRVADLTLDRSAFPQAADLQDEAALGRLITTTALGDTDGDGDHDRIYSLGGRSFTIWDLSSTTPEIVYDSGSVLEEILIRETPAGFNANDGLIGEFDQRSDDKGPEPEAVVTGVVGSRTYAFVGLERALGGVVVFDISEPGAPEYVTYILSNDGTGGPGNDISPEGLLFVPADESPSGRPLVVASYEVSGTVAIYELTLGF